MASDPLAGNAMPIKVVVGRQTVRIAALLWANHRQRVLEVVGRHIDDALTANVKGAASKRKREARKRQAAR